MYMLTQQHGTRSLLIPGRARRTQVKRQVRRTMGAAAVPHIGRARTSLREAVLVVQLEASMCSPSSNALQKVGMCHDLASNVTRARFHAPPFGLRNCRMRLAAALGTGRSRSPGGGGTLPRPAGRISSPCRAQPRLGGSCCNPPGPGGGAGLSLPRAVLLHRPGHRGSGR